MADSDSHSPHCLSEPDSLYISPLTQTLTVLAIWLP
jgi:hypothetical protein